MESEFAGCYFIDCRVDDSDFLEASGAVVLFEGPWDYEDMLSRAETVCVPHAKWIHTKHLERYEYPEDEVLEEWVVPCETEGHRICNV